MGNGIYLGCQYGMLMVLAKLGSPTLVGQFSLALAVTAPVVILSQMQLRQLQITDVRGEYGFADYFLVRLIGSALALAVIGVVISVSSYPLETRAVIGLTGLAKAVESLSDIVHGYLQRLERMDRVAISLVVKGTASLVVFGAALWYGQGLLGAVAGLCATWGAVLVAYDLPMIARMLEPPARLIAWRPSSGGRLAVLALEPGLAAGLASLSGNVPRYFLESLRGHEALGLFAVAAAPLTLLTLLTSAIGQATMPRAAVHFQKGEVQAFRALAARVSIVQVLVTATGTGLFAMFGTPMLRVLFTAEYAGTVPVLVTMAAGLTVGSLATFGSAVLTAGRMFRLQLWNVVLMLVGQIPVCYYLIGRWGAPGAGWAEFIRYALFTVFLHLVGVFVYRRRFADRV